MSEQLHEQKKEPREISPSSGPSSSFLSEKLSDIRIILLGGRELFGREASGKSTTGNIILGKNAFEVGKRTARSVQAENEVHGRHVTVVDTPGWWWHFSVVDTPYFDRLEIIRSTTLCPPGPHAVLLVIPIDIHFVEIKRMALEKHLEFLSETVWSHIIVLFTTIAPYDDNTVKNIIKNCPDLQLLLLKCQNRYHVLNITNKEDSYQVITLLKKTEKMIAQNNGQYLKVDKGVFALDMREVTTNESGNKRIFAMETRSAELQERIRDEEQDLTRIRIVMLGASWASRSSAGNLILGKESFEVGGARTTVCCSVKHADVDEKLLTVVDTPGWYYNYPLEKTPEMDKLEIRRSVHLCPPGPHAILLTIPIAITYDKTVHKAVEEHMGLLEEKVWNHTIVLFTWGDCLGDTTIEERIEKEDKHLELLIEKCGNRYHVFNCKNHTDRTQVTELFKKIEEMTMENNGSHYEPEMERNPSLDLDLILKTTRTNMKKVNREKVILQELVKERKKHLSELRIVLLGVEGVGKSAPGNIILQGPFFKNRLGKDFKTLRISQCVMQQSKVGRYQVFVVDTPGWSKSTQNAREIVRSVKVCSPGPHAFMLVLPVDEAFTKKTQDAVEQLMKLFGKDVWRHTIILFTEGHWLKDRPIEEHIVCEGEALQSLVERCENRYEVLVNDLNNKSQGKKLFKMIEDTLARNRGEYFTLGKKKRDTTSQQFERSKTLSEEAWNKHEDELIERMLEAAVVDLDEESKQQLARRRGSFDYAVPSMSAENTRADTQNPGEPQRIQLTKCQVPSSGYYSITNTLCSEDPKTEDVRKDIPTHRQSGSFDYAVPSLSGDSVSDNTSVSTADTQNSGIQRLFLYTLYKLTGHHNKSTNSSSQDPTSENIRNDIPTTKHQQTGTD